MGKPRTLNARRERPPITMPQAERFHDDVEEIFKTFAIGISQRAKIDVRLTVYAEAYKQALHRNSPREVCEFLEEKYKGAIAALDDYVAGAPQAVRA